MNEWMNELNRFLSGNHKESLLSIVSEIYSVISYMLNAKFSSLVVPVIFVFRVYWSSRTRDIVKLFWILKRNW